MNYQEIYETYQDLKETLILKKDAIMKKNLEEINKTDEHCIVLCEKIAKFDIKNNQNNITQEQKENLTNLGSEIKVIQENNEILIKHSLDVINGILSGILNIAQSDKCSYNSKGETKKDEESLNISSITEEA